MSKRKGDGTRTCKRCGSTSLWGNHFNADGEGDPAGTWDILCEDCGAFQIRKGTP